MSIIIREAMARWQDMREDYHLRLRSHYQRAVADCRGELLNRRGKAAGVDPQSLFLGPRSRVVAYASEELLEWWQVPGNERMTVEQFERQWLTTEHN